MIAEAVRHLGDDDFADREAAMRKVWEFGDDAVPALTAAKEGNDPELRYRATLLLRQIALGIRPDMPADVAQHLEQYRTGDRVAKRHSVVWLEARGAIPLLLKLAKQETDDYVKSQIREAINRNALEATPALIVRQRWKDAEDLLLTARSIQPQGETTLNLARLYWSTGRIKEGIERLKADSAEGPADRNTLDLASLTALTGKWSDAAALANRGGNPQLAASFLLASRDWKSLADAPPVAGTDVDARELKTKSAEVLLWDLAGDKQQSAVVLLDLKQLRNSEPQPDEARAKAALRLRRLWSTRMLILEQFDDAFKGLETDDPVLLAMLRIRRQEYHQLADLLRWDQQPAFDDAWLNALPTKPDQPRETQLDLAILSAKALVACGRTDDARRILDTLARNPLPERTKGIHHTLLAYAALECDQWDRFLDYAVVALEELSGNTFWDRIAPQQAATAKLWHTYFEGLDFSEKKRERLTHIAQLCGVRRAPRATEEELNELFTASQGRIDSLPAASQPVRIALIAEASLRHGRRDQARKLFERIAAEDPQALLALGDLAAGDKDSAAAAKWYAQSWERYLRNGRAVAVKRPPVKVARAAPAIADEDPFDDAPRRRPRVAERTEQVEDEFGDDRAALPHVIREKNALLSLYLQGVHTPGDEGQQLRRVALALVPNVELYLVLADGLLQRGYLRESKAIYELVTCLSPLGSTPHAGAISQLASVASRTEPNAESIAARWEQSRVMSLLAGATFTQPDSYCDLPRVKHLARAQAALSGKEIDQAAFDAAIRSIHRASPADMRSYETLRPLLVQKGAQATADKLFAEDYTYYRGLADEFPNSAHFANQLSWLCAISHEKLDEAKRLAELAVKANPDQAAYLDTLAEVHFQLGDRAAALKLSKRALELSPNNAEMQRRLKHFESDSLPSK
jgi:tetratricopeptide (TPR) repeat protein